MKPMRILTFFFVLLCYVFLTDMQAQERKALRYRMEGATWKPVWFICDAPRQLIVVHRAKYAVKEISNKTLNPVLFEFIAKGDASKVVKKTYYVYDEGGGMGKFGYGFLKQDKTEAGIATFSNIGGYDPEYYYSFWAGFPYRLQIDGYDCTCWTPQRAIFSGQTNRRTLHITQTDDGDWRYATYDFKTTAASPASVQSMEGRPSSLNLLGGIRQIDNLKKKDMYTFNNEGYSYVVEIGKEKASAVLIVKKGEQVIQRENFLAYIYARE